MCMKYFLKMVMKMIHLLFYSKGKDGKEHIIKLNNFTNDAIGAVGK